MSQSSFYQSNNNQKSLSRITTMFNSSTFELITLAASNSHLIFCFCNLIIVILIACSPKTPSHFDEDTAASTSSSVDNHVNSCDSFDQNVLTVVKKAPCFKKTSRKVPCVDKVLAKDKEQKTKEDEDEELRIRVEEFIKIVHRGWQAERIGTSLVH